MISRFGMRLCVALLVFLGGLAVTHRAVTETQGANRVFELRTYTANEGKLQALLDRFGGGETDLFEKHGMRGIGYWVAAEEPLDENTLVYMLAHESRDAARASWRAFLEDPEWVAMRDASEVDGRLVSNVVSIFLNPTDFSPAGRRGASGGSLPVPN